MPQLAQKAGLVAKNARDHLDPGDHSWDANKLRDYVVSIAPV